MELPADFLSLGRGSARHNHSLCTRMGKIINPSKVTKDKASNNGNKEKEGNNNEI